MNVNWIVDYDRVVKKEFTQDWKILYLEKITHASNTKSFSCENTYIFSNCSSITFCFKLPGRKGTGPGGWMIQAKLQVYFWLGSIKHKKSYPSGLPPGFQVTNELLNAERPGLPPPTAIHYAEKHVTKI